MNGRARIGELLSRMVPLTVHDVEEILQEQNSNRRRFGEIALSWGLCRPEHVWDAWCQQSESGVEIVDLEKIGVDAQAANLLCGDTARQLQCIPVRIAGDAVLIATADASSETLIRDLPALLKRRVKFVRADAQELQRIIGTYYPVLAS